MRLATRLHFGVSLQGPFSLVPRLSVGGARVLIMIAFPEWGICVAGNMATYQIVPRSCFVRYNIQVLILVCQ